MRARVVTALLLAGIVGLASACGPSGSGSASPSGPSGTITVFAASSLSAAFTTLGADFEKSHPGTMVRFSFAGSSSLAAQIQKVALGEADAGIVYVTDVKAAGQSVEGVAIAPALNVVAEYPIVILKDSQNRALARAFISYVHTGGRETLARYGFTNP